MMPPELLEGRTPAGSFGEVLLAGIFLALESEPGQKDLHDDSLEFESSLAKTERTTNRRADREAPGDRGFDLPVVDGLLQNESVEVPNNSAIRHGHDVSSHMLPMRQARSFDTAAIDIGATLQSIADLDSLTAELAARLPSAPIVHPPHLPTATTSGGGGDASAAGGSGGGVMNQAAANFLNGAPSHSAESSAFVSARSADVPEGEGPWPNTPPVANNDGYWELHDKTLIVTAPGVLDNDVDPDGDPLTAQIGTPPLNAVNFTFNPSDGSFTYQPPAGWAGTDSFTYTAFDGTDHSEPATVTIGILNSAPYVEAPLTDFWQGTDQGGTEYVDLWASFEDDDDTDQQLTYTVEQNTNPALFSDFYLDEASGILVLSFSDDAPTGVSDITVRATDRVGEYAEQSFQVTVFEVTGITLELEVDDNVWEVVPESDWSWSHDILRWTVQVSPSLPSTPSVDWEKAPWDLRDDPQAPWASFAGGQPGIGNPGPGVWAIRPSVTFQVGTAMNFVQKRNDAEIQSVSWVGVDPGDGATNLSNDNPVVVDGNELSGTYLGGGWRLFPGKNTSTGPTHQDVKVRVLVIPNEANITIHLKAIDADDPTDENGPIDVDPGTLADNIGGANWTTTTATTVVDPNGNAAIAEKVFRLNTYYAGDNYRIVAASRTWDMPQIKPVRPADLGTVFHDKDQDDIYDANGEEPFISQNGTRTSRNWFYTTPLLTVWRRLFIERDAMGAPDPDLLYGFDPNQPVDDPDPGGALPLPDTSLFPDAFDTAFILPVNLPAAPAPPDLPTPDEPSESDLEFKRHFPDAVKRDAYLSLGRDTHPPEDPEWWTVYIIGIYEEFAGASNDNDDDGEYGRPGATIADPGYSMIFNEVIRDLGVEHDQAWNNPQDTDWVRAIVALHEVGHQFGLGHGGHTFPEDLMAPPSPSEEHRMPEHQPNFTELDIKKIRETWTL